MTERVSFPRRLLGRQPPREVAGIDLGSNSFHMVVARAEEDGRVHVLDRLRDPVRLAAGLDEKGFLRPAAVERAVQALARFGERVRDMPSSAVRAVATNTVRRAHNGAEVGEAFSRALGHPVEIISGPEEARLIYQGVSHVTPEAPGRLLVLDIGGGSTECIIGQGFEPLALDSLYMGCVGYTEQFFDDGVIDRERFHAARLAAGLELASILNRYRALGWERAVGSSGTILAAKEVMRASGWGEELLTPAVLAKLEEAMIACKRIDALSLPGLDPDRAAVFPGGVAILGAAFHFLEIEAMGTSSGALREGLIYELLGRTGKGDPRDSTIETLALRYKVDRAHARRVAATAASIFEQANAAWDHDAESALRLLAWAAEVHELGLSIAYAGFHRHGAYILEHGDLPGFSLDEQAMLATLVGTSRRKFSRQAFAALPRERRSLALHLSLALRLAVRLHHSRSEEPLPPLQVRARKSRLRLCFPAGWLTARPLTRADLEEEAAILSKVGIRLELEDEGKPAA